MTHRHARDPRYRRLPSRPDPRCAGRDVMAAVTTSQGGSGPRTSPGRSGPAFELLESKLRPPQGLHGTVVRERLIDRLEEESESNPALFLSAGPGWGKTTVLAQWASRSQRPFAWVSVDKSDNDPIVLLTYIAAALDRVSRLDPGVFEALASPGASLEGTIVPRLGAALGSHGRSACPGSGRPPPARQSGLPRRHRDTHEARVGRLADRLLGARQGGAAGGAARTGPGAGDRPRGPANGQGGGAAAVERGRSGSAGRPDRRGDRAHGGLGRWSVHGRAVAEVTRGQGQRRGYLLRE